jgi:hypothetical protein
MRLDPSYLRDDASTSWPHPMTDARSTLLRGLPQRLQRSPLWQRLAFRSRAERPRRLDGANGLVLGVILGLLLWAAVIAALTWIL